MNTLKLCSVCAGVFFLCTSGKASLVIDLAEKSVQPFGSDITSYKDAAPGSFVLSKSDSLTGRPAFPAWLGPSTSAPSPSASETGVFRQTDIFENNSGHQSDGAPPPRAVVPEPATIFSGLLALLPLALAIREKIWKQAPVLPGGGS